MPSFMLSVSFIALRLSQSVKLSEFQSTFQFCLPFCLAIAFSLPYVYMPASLLDLFVIATQKKFVFLLMSIDSIKLHPRA